MSNNREKDEEIILSYLNNNNKKLKNINFNNTDIFSSYILNALSSSASSLSSQTVSSLLDNFNNFIYNLKGLKIFFRYREPIPFPNFIPSYKLLDNRINSKKKKNSSTNFTDDDFDINFLDSNWITNNYSFQADDDIFTSSQYYSSLSGLNSPVGGSNLSVDHTNLASPNPSSRFNFLRRKDSKLTIDPSGSGTSATAQTSGVIPSGLSCPSPSFVNRIFYTSMTDLVDEFLPEPLEINFNVLLDPNTTSSAGLTSASNAGSNRFSMSSNSTENERESIRLSTVSQRSEEDEELLQSFSSASSFAPSSTAPASASLTNNKNYVKKFTKYYNLISTDTSSSSSITSRVDNYRSLNSGDIFANSNHLPISCSFLLKVPTNIASPCTSSSIPPTIVPKLGIRITDIKVLFGADDFIPLKVRILFPTPFEFTASHLPPATVSDDEDQNLMGPSYISDSSFPLFSSDVTFLNSFNEHLTGDAPSASPTTTSNLSTPVKNVPQNASFDASCLNSNWESLTPKYSSSLCLESWRGGMSKNALSYPPLILTWKHSQISLENLHIGFFITLPPSFSTLSSLQSSVGPVSPNPVSSTTPSPFSNSSLLGSGQCSVSVSQIYRAALRSSGLTGAQTVTRLLLSQGHPLTTPDDEFLTFTCKLELVPL